MNWKDMNWTTLKNLDKDDLLEAIGLQSRRSTSAQWFTNIGIFAAGAAVGAVVALLFAPKAGRELREEISSKMWSHGSAVPPPHPTNSAGAQRPG